MAQTSHYMIIKYTRTPLHGRYDYIVNKIGRIDIVPERKHHRFKKVSESFQMMIYSISHGMNGDV